jgi:hypothetical protein
MMRDHRSAGAGRNHDELGARKYLQEVPFYGARFIHESGIESGLSAAGLRLTEFDLAAGPFEDLGHGEAHARKDLVDQAGDENRNAVFQSSVCPSGNLTAAASSGRTASRTRIGMRISFTVLDSPVTQP